MADDVPHYEVLLKRFRKRPLFAPGDLPMPLGCGKAEIEKLIPHRDPFLLVDSITAIDMLQSRLAGKRHVAANDPVFLGHFPEIPVYPGTLQVEMLGQLGGALCALLEEPEARIAPGRNPSIVRATRVLGAIFPEPVLPGKDALLIGQRVEWDGSLARFIGQVIVEEKVCTVVAGELWVLR